MASDNRPLSPHLQVYRWQMTMALSILHRMSGVGLVLGLFLLTWWLIAAAAGPEYFQYVQAIFGSEIGRVLLFGFTLALFYHLCNGIRHLIWDAGYGFELDAMTRSGWLVLVASVMLTLATFGLGYAMR
ncbi:MAG: succinate dehydrogenase, cytochrome b556 subunit [Alphaproteobacteria bacterium]|jgi:succinate dehydrogenase / fumarate reductase cytochrome b subunit|nr:succinate dehydrogenase, cytochrome b556 subunit [Alphaproteobacteria bacterium]MDP6565615.1 succinate dehydrogenase, cytochrome b556 subunit [Alphaproteobacteria bacterium]MDP6813230.1 succinate dehydrogenase, cytochrome b556 subunit [Alphaproteobacteria bacterium]